MPQHGDAECFFTAFVEEGREGVCVLNLNRPNVDRQNDPSVSVCIKHVNRTSERQRGIPMERTAAQSATGE